MRQINQRGLKLVMAFEGFREMVYLCTANYWTIGYGHMIRPFDKTRDTREIMSANPFPNGVTKAEAEALLSDDLETAERAVSRLVKFPISENQFSALVSFTFNLGAGNLQASTLRRKINRGELEEASAEFMKWTISGGRKTPGLVRRRQAESALFMSA